MRPKIFCVGLHKAGTTSLHGFFRSLGLNSTHSTTWSRQPLPHDTLRSHDAFSDGGGHFWDDSLEFGGNHELRALRDAYPDSRFILQYRAMRPWIVSKMLHAGWRKDTAVEDRAAPFSHEEWRTKSMAVLQAWVENRLRYHEAAVAFLGELPQGQVMAVDITSEDDAARRVAEFVMAPRRAIVAGQMHRTMRTANRVLPGVAIAPKSFPRENSSKAAPPDKEHCQMLADDILGPYASEIDADRDLLRRLAGRAPIEGAHPGQS